MRFANVATFGWRPVVSDAFRFFGSVMYNMDLCSPTPLSEWCSSIPFFGSTSQTILADFPASLRLLYNSVDVNPSRSIRLCGSTKSISFTSFFRRRSTPLGKLFSIVTTFLSIWKTEPTIELILTPMSASIVMPADQISLFTGL